MGNKCLYKNFFHKHKYLNDIDEVDVENIVISSKDLYDEKGPFEYFIGYRNNSIKPLCIKLPQMLYTSYI